MNRSYLVKKYPTLKPLSDRRIVRLIGSDLWTKRNKSFVDEIMEWLIEPDERQAPNMTTHELKCDMVHFEPVYKGNKTAEFRLNDRDFKVGDELVLREWDKANKVYTARGVHRRITDVADLSEWAPGYVLLSFY